MGDEVATFWEDFRRNIATASDMVEEWQGFPVPVHDIPVVLNDRHPLRAGYTKIQATMTTVVGTHSCSTEDVAEDMHVRNEWYSYRLNSYVTIYQKGDQIRFLKTPISPDHSMERFDLWLQTLGASDAWDVEAELRARKMLRGMVTERQWRHYDLTGAFLETSPRSRLTYLFRRLRPTVVMTPRNSRNRDYMRMLAVLCLHPIGYYSRSWAGCLVPTDDVISHLTFMRGDEAEFWAQANQHRPSQPEAGL